MTSLPWFIRARLKTRQLMLLIAIDEEGNIHRAAEVLSMSQPAASKLLKDLEDMLGVALFERLPRGMRATWYGESLIRHARISLASLSEAGAEIEALRSGRAGSVAIGAIAGPSMTLLPSALAQITRERPDLQVSLLVESSDVLLERLAQNRVDFLVARLFPRHDKSQLQYEALAEEDVCAIVRPQHPILALRKVELRHLAEADWIVPPVGSVLRHRFELMFQSAGLQPPRQVIGTAALMFLTKILQETDYMAVVPTDVARHYAQFGMVAVVPYELSCRMDSFGLITRRDWLLSPAARTVLDAVKTAAAQIYAAEMA